MKLATITGRIEGEWSRPRPASGWSSRRDSTSKRPVRLSDNTRMAVVSAADLGVPEIFNAAQFFLDRHIEEGRGHKVAIECGEARMTYAELRGARQPLRPRAGRCLWRAARRARDAPAPRRFAFAAAFWGAIKVGAVAVPVNTLAAPRRLSPPARRQPRPRPRRQRRITASRSTDPLRRLAGGCATSSSLAQRRKAACCRPTT